MTVCNFQGWFFFLSLSFFFSFSLPSSLSLLYLFISLAAQRQVSVAACGCGIFVAACGLLSYGMWDLVPRPGIEPRPPALGAQSLNHWTTSEVPQGS